MPDFSPCQIAHQQKHKHGEDKMVGNDGRKHHIGKPKQQERHQSCIHMANPYHLATYPVHENEGIETTEQSNGSNNKNGAVDASDCHQCLVEQIRREHHECQQRMAIDIVTRFPIGYHLISDRVDAGETVFASKNLPTIAAERCKLLIIRTQKNHSKH